MRTEKINFNKRYIESLPSPKGLRSKDYYDAAQRGLTLRVTDTGSKSFYFRKTVSYKIERVFLGRFPEMTVEQAFPVTKNKESHLVPLTGPAVEILRRRAQSNKTGWVFPGRMKDCHLVEPKRVWYKLVEDAGLEDLRMHDLRRTLASYMAITNHSLPIIARALGHKSTQATQIYSRLTQDPVRNAMDLAIAQIHLLAQSDEEGTTVDVDARDSCA